MDQERVKRIYREFFYRYIDMELTGEQAKAGKWIVDDLLAHDRIPTMEIMKYLIENSKGEGREGEFPKLDIHIKL